MTGKFSTLSNVDTLIVKFSWVHIKDKQVPVAVLVPPSVDSCSEALWLWRKPGPPVSSPLQLLCFLAACI